MALAGYNDGMMWRNAQTAPVEDACETPVWEEATTWLALLPTIFITVGGWIHTDSTAVAYRFTAMEEDSFARKMVRLGCAIVVIYLISTRFRSILSICGRSKLLLMLPAVTIASVLWSQNPLHSLVDAANLTLTTLFVFYLYSRYPGDRLVSFLNFAACIALIMSVIAVVAFPAVGMDAYQDNAWRGVFAQRNNCATTCVLFLLVGLHTPVRGLIEQLMRACVIFSSLLFIVMSGSRTGWIVAVLAFALTYGLRIISRIRSLDRLLVLMVLAVPVSLGAYFIGLQFTEILAVLDKDPTLSQRTVIWAEVIPSILKHPLLGYGYSSFWQGLNGESVQTVLTTGWMEGQAQDGYLDILLQVGVVGLLPFIALFLRGFRQAYRSIEQHRLDWMSMLAIVMLPIILIENIGESTVLLPLGMPWVYALACLLALDLRSSDAEVA